MNLNLDFPIPLTRLTKSEIDALNIWHERLITDLRRFVTSVEDDNIKSVSAEKISGSIGLDKLTIPSAELVVSDDGFKITADDGTYIELSDGRFNIHANII